MCLPITGNRARQANSRLIDLLGQQFRVCWVNEVSVSCCTRYVYKII